VFFAVKKVFLIPDTGIDGKGCWRDNTFENSGLKCFASDPQKNAKNHPNNVVKIS
jgi:hypothetical protein